MFPVDLRTDVVTDSWPEFQRELAETLVLLPNGGWVHVVQREVPAWAVPPPEHRTRGWRRLVDRIFEPGGGQEPTAEPYVTFQRMRHHLLAETCAPSDLGGRINLSAEQEAQLRELGWANPRTRGKKDFDTDNFAAFFPNEGHPSQILSEADPVRGTHVVEWEYARLVDFGEVVRLAWATLRGPLRIDQPNELWVERSDGWHHRKKKK